MHPWLHPILNYEGGAVGLFSSITSHVQDFPRSPMRTWLWYRSSVFAKPWILLCGVHNVKEIYVVEILENKGSFRKSLSLVSPKYHFYGVWREILYFVSGAKIFILFEQL